MSTQSRGHVNAHTHLYSGLAPLDMPAPRIPPQTFVEILERVWWPLDRALDATSLRASARLYVAEALLAGTTAIIDHHESPNFIEGSLDVLADACQRLGMRAVLCYGATERNGEQEEAQRGLGECRRFIQTNNRPLVRGVVGLHAGFTVSDDTIRSAATLARELGTVLHVHVAEDRADVADAERRGDASPIARMARLNALIPGSIFAHGVHLSVDDVKRARDAGCWFVQNPRSNANNRVGYPSNLIASDRVALGTDGFPSDMAEELSALREHAAAADQDPEIVAARLNAGHDLLAQLNDVPAQITSLGTTIGSRLVVSDGKLLADDLETIRAEAREQAQRLWKRMERQ